MRDWQPGGMPYADLWKDMNVDEKVFDFYVRIITIMEGPYKGDAYVLAQDVYRIAKGSVVTKQAINQAYYCTIAGIESIVGPNIVREFKYANCHKVSDRTNLMWLKFCTNHCCPNHLCTTNWNLYFSQGGLD